MQIVHDSASTVKNKFSSRKVTLDDFHKLRRRLHRGGNFSTFWTPNLNGKKRTLWFAADQDLPLPRGWFDANVYFGVHPTEQKGEYYQRSTIGAISAINCLFAEIDGKDMVQPTDEQIAVELANVTADAEKRLASGELQRMTPAKVLQRMAVAQAKANVFLTDIDGYNELARRHVETMTPRPSAIVQSGGGYHLYWFLSDTFHIRTDDDRQRAKQLQARWVAYVGGDEGAKDLARVLRPVGTFNVKPKYAPNYPAVTFTHIDYRTEYSIDELEGYLPAVEIAPVRTAPAERTDAPTDATANRQPTATGEHSAHVYRVMQAYNERNTIESTLQRYGYTNAGNGRFVRPGGTSASVAVLDGKSYHHSSSDPLFEATGEHRLSSFDVVVHWDYAGDYERAAIRIGLDLGVYEPGLIEFVITKEMERAEFDDWKAIVPEDRQVQTKSGTRYVTANTDRPCYQNLLRLMGERKRLVNLLTTTRAASSTVNSDGVPVAICSHQTFQRFLDRVDGVLLTHKTVSLPDNPNAKMTAISLADTVVLRWTKLYYHTDNNTLVQVKTTGKVHEYYADDAFLRGRSAVVREKVAGTIDAYADEYPHFKRARDSHEAIKTEAYRSAQASLEVAKELVPVNTIKRQMMGANVYQAWIDLKQIAESDFLPALGFTGALVLDELTKTPDATRREIEKARGLTASAVGGALRKLEAWGLVSSERSAVNKAKCYSVAGDVWAEVKRRSPEAMTYTVGAQRRDKQLEQTHAYAKRQELEARGTDDEKRARRRLAKIENKRFLTLPIVHPEFTEKQTADWIYGATAHYDNMIPTKPVTKTPMATETAIDKACRRFNELLGQTLRTTPHRQEFRRLDALLGTGYHAKVDERMQQAADSLSAGDNGYTAKEIIDLLSGGGHYYYEEARTVAVKAAGKEKYAPVRLHVNGTVAHGLPNVA